MEQRQLDRLLGRLVTLGGSDLHVKVGSRPRVRLHGELVQLVEEPPVLADGLEQLARSMMHDRARRRFDEHFEADFAYSVSGLGRFRVNAYRQRGSVGMVLRHVRIDPPSIGDLRLPDSVRRLAEERRGLVLVGGPAGSGTTTTLAAMVDHINATRECHVVTIEEPVEVLHRDRLASISQREVGLDTDSYATALRSVLRQDPDVVVVGELHDAETMAMALSAAETGQLVLSSLRAGDAAEAVRRVVELFPPEQQQKARLSLSGALRGTICQRLVPTIDGSGRVPVVEVMVVNARAQQCIAEASRVAGLSEVVAEGDYYGMQTFAQCLYRLVEDRVIDVDVALAAAPNPHELRLMVQRGGMAQAVLGPLVAPCRF